MTTQKTRCPYCSSVFAVSNAQLAIRDGYTRCGKCFQVFKADDYLINKAPDAAGTTGESTPSATTSQPLTRSHIVDLHKIDSTKSKSLDNAGDSFLDPKKLPLPSIIDFEHTKKKEKVDLSILPNEHPEPEEREPLQADPDAYLTAEIEEPLEPLNHEFNEQWLTETANPTNPLAQPTHPEAAQLPPVQEKQSAASTSESNQPMTDEDLMSYLNKNTVPASHLKTKTEPALPEMNDFHANQRSKKKAQDIPMHIGIAKRNQALDRLTARKRWFTVDFFHFLGWAFASLLMAGLLVAQYLFFNFDRLAANPSYQPTMHRACLTLGCDVPLIDLEKIKLSNIIAGSFQPSPLDSTIFTANMVNSADESQPFPNLRLIVLKDRKILSGRIIHPAEYLKTGYNSQARIAVNHPTHIAFVLRIPRDQIPVFALDPVK
ncbi:MAG: hypothetical protein NVS3B3_01950 [Aquirhabdus sp.]